MSLIKQLLPSLKMTIFLAILTGLIFPLVITGIAGVVFPDKANGSLVRRPDGTVLGSSLLAQGFSQPKYFHPRPSAAGSGYAGEASSGTNLGPTSSKLFQGIADDPATKADESFAGVKQLAQTYIKENGLTAGTNIPVDAVTRSASGLDPDISEANAALQASRVAGARGMTVEQVTAVIKQVRTDRDLGILGEPRINVLTLNLALDSGHAHSESAHSAQGVTEPK